MEEIVLDLSVGECIIGGLTASAAVVALVLSWCIVFDKNRQNMKGNLLKSSLVAIVMTVLTIATILRWFKVFWVLLGVILLVPLATAIYLIFKDNNKIKYKQDE